MVKNSKQIEEEIQKIKKEISSISSKNAVDSNTAELSALVKYLIEEREHTNRILASVTQRLRELESEIKENQPAPELQKAEGKEVPISSTDAQILLFVQEHNMVCAADLQSYMHYRGKNAASARLNKLYKEGLLERFQLGHKVYYKYDAGKTTNTLIVSPPQ
ncbi:MAG: hypothetical protein ACP5K9_02155 [Candidatus Micrarchaeia archaeon]